MGLLDKIVGVMKIDNDEEDYYYDDEDEYLDEEQEAAPEPRKRSGRGESVKEVEKSSRGSSKNSNITSMQSLKKKKSVDSNGREVCMFKPTSMDESCDIMDALLADRTVVLNLEGINEDLAQRIIDTISGSCYSLGGNMLKVSNFIFIVAPKTVELSGDSQGNVIRSTFDMPMAAGSRY